jgi:hypothetical protein
MQVRGALGGIRTPNLLIRSAPLPGDTGRLQAAGVRLSTPLAAPNTPGGLHFAPRPAPRDGQPHRRTAAEPGTSSGREALPGSGRSVNLTLTRHSPRVGERDPLRRVRVPRRGPPARHRPNDLRSAAGAGGDAGGRADPDHPRRQSTTEALRLSEVMTMTKTKAEAADHGLDSLDPAKNPARDAVHFRRIIAAARTWPSPKTNYGKPSPPPAKPARPGPSSAPPSTPPAKPPTNASATSPTRTPTPPSMTHVRASGRSRLIPPRHSVCGDSCTATLTASNHGLRRRFIPQVIPLGSSSPAL